MGFSTLVECPICGTEVTNAVKCWTVSRAKYTERRFVPEFRVGIFKCRRCGSKFRSRVRSTGKPVEPKNVKFLAARLMEIREGLSQNLRVLREKIYVLETERAGLLVEIDQLKKVAESRASALEVEVKQLREELRSLRELLGASE